MFPQGEEATLGVFVMDEYADVGWAGMCHDLDGIDCGADYGGDFVGADVEAVIDCEAVLEYDEGGRFVCGVGDGVDHDVSDPQ